MNIILCGMPASGKSTVAKELGRVYGLEVVDTDFLIGQRYGDIGGIFATLGEDKFRDMESEAVREAASLDSAVISLGGGAVLRECNVEELKKNGKIVYLRVTPDTLKSRLEGDGTRPLLKGGSAALEKLYKARAGVYEAVADFTLDADGLSPKLIAKKIMGLIK